EYLLAASPIFGHPETIDVGPPPFAAPVVCVRRARRLEQLERAPLVARHHAAEGEHQTEIHTRERLSALAGALEQDSGALSVGKHADARCIGSGETDAALAESGVAGARIQLHRARPVTRNAQALLVRDGELVAARAVFPFARLAKERQ